MASMVIIVTTVMVLIGVNVDSSDCEGYGDCEESAGVDGDDDYYLFILFIHL